MKKSEIYKLAQISVLQSNIDKLAKLKVLRELMGQEDIYLLVENKEEEERVAQAV